ncbi:MAG: carbohydrate porin [Planctomycetota bacterium]|jgi:hypothetical protein
MYRYLTVPLVVLLVAFQAPANAGDQDAAAAAEAKAKRDKEIRELKEKLKKLEDKVEVLEDERSTILDREIDDFLRDAPPELGLQGDGTLARVSLRARFTAVVQGTVGLSPSNRTVVNGDIDLDFAFQVTDNLVMFAYLTANADEEMGTSFPPQWGDGTHGVPPRSFPRIGWTTFSGLTDGIGVNGTTPTDPGSITVYEAGIRHSIGIGDNELFWEIGALDPRRRFLQNAFADDENTQFINNLFDDAPSVYWLTDATGRTSYGIHVWFTFGREEQYTVSAGWFNTPGQFFNQGQLYVQFAWKLQVRGREMNVRAMGFIDEYFQDAAGDGSAGGGASWDWLITDKIGLFARLVANGGDANPVELDGSVGAAFTGLIGSRPDDTLGVAVGFINVSGFAASGQFVRDTEMVVEIYYRFIIEDSIQITPHIMIVYDAGGGKGVSFDDETIYILGLRIHVPF